MIKALRRKFVLITMSLLVLVFFVALLLLNLTVKKNDYSSAVAELYSLADSNRMPRFEVREGDFSSVPDEDTASAEDTDDTGRSENRPWKNTMALKEIYMFRFDADGSILRQSSLFDYDNEQEAVVSMAEKAFAQGKNSGLVDSFIFISTEKRDGTLVVLRNFEETLASEKRLLLHSVLIGGMALAVLFLVSCFLAKLATAPADKAFRYQKQFIADASHELKTPLSAIGINADVLQGEIGNNRWLDNIITECKNMEALVLSLLTLAKIDAFENRAALQEDADLSDIAAQAEVTFDSMAFEKGIQFHVEIQENIHLKGSSSELKQLILSLLENAFKYVDERGEVSLCLEQVNGSPALTISNTGPDIAEEEIPHLFERFYRADSVRTGGSKSFGLGLSIAESIVRKHKGKISVTSRNGVTAFRVTF